MRKVQRDQANRRERRNRDERERAEFARDTARRAGFRIRDALGGEFDRFGFSWTCDGYGTSITWTMMNGRLPTLWMK